jgi:osmotically-inducible protein OsmY
MNFRGSATRCLAIGLFASAALLAQDPNADNTKRNRGDGSASAVTADQQKMNKSDRELTQEIRKSVMADKSLSTYAHNVKIISQHGRVTLRGPVRSDEEKQTIEAKAVEAAGGHDKVDNQLTVKASR